MTETSPVDSTAFRTSGVINADQTVIAGHTTSGEALRIRGGNPLSGEIRIGGSKNLGLPALTAALLTDEPCVFENMPAIEDTKTMLRLLRELGATVSPDPTAPDFFDQLRSKRRVHVQAASVVSGDISRHLGQAMRASILLMGPLLARHGRVLMVFGGGDDIGARPIDVTIRGFVAMGARESIEDGHRLLSCDWLEGKSIFLDYPTHTGTENLLMAAVLASGTTTIVNAACEPEIIAFGTMLNRMGADISGLGTPIITVKGVNRLRGAYERIMPDRLVAGTYAIGAVVTRGELIISGVSGADLLPVTHKLREAGAQILVDDETMFVRGPQQLRPIDIQSLPYPGFPTDQQAVMSVLLTQCNGISRLHERVYEDRLRYIPDLQKMGADIILDPKGVQAEFHGPSRLHGTTVAARDIRAGAAVVLAGLIAEGDTIVTGVHHLDRGYEDLVPTLKGVGADIISVPMPDSPSA